jgi:hypothetical protein
MSFHFISTFTAVCFICPTNNDKLKLYIIKMAQRWLPNYADFFHSLGRLIEICERQRPSQRRCGWVWKDIVSPFKSRRNVQRYAFCLEFLVLLEWDTLPIPVEQLESLSNVEESDEYNEPGYEHLNFHPDDGVSTYPIWISFGIGFLKQKGICFHDSLFLEVISAVY